MHKGPSDGVNTFNTINSALSQIATLGDSCSGNPYLIIIGPGVYEEDISADGNICITLRGSGRENTKIIGAGQSMFTINLSRVNWTIENVSVHGAYAGNPTWGFAPSAVRAWLSTIFIRNCLVDANANYSTIADEGLRCSLKTATSEENGILRLRME